jgi:hypothetical protein
MMNAQNAQTTAQYKTVPGAESQQTPASRAKESVAQISSRVVLTSEQVGKITSAYTDFFTNQDAVKAQKATLSAKEFDAKIAEVKSQRDAAIKATLSSEQLATLQKAKKEMDATNVAGRPGTK